MTHLTGLVMFAFGGWLFYAARARRERVLAARREAAARGDPEPPPLHPSLAMIGDIVPGLVKFFLAFTGVKATFFFFALGGGGVFSIVDLAGFLFLLAAYGTWLTIRTSYRDLAPAPAVVERRPEAAQMVCADHDGGRRDERGSPDTARAAAGVRRGAGVRGLADDLAAAGEAPAGEEPRRRRAG